VPYIGTQIEAGNYRKLTNLASGFNGVTTTFTLSVPPGTSQYYVTPTSTYQLLISVGGIIQQPDTDYTVSTNTITFTTAPTAGLSFFGILMGDALNVGTPSDGTVTTAKLASSAVSNDKLADSSVTQSKIGANVLTPTVSQINGGPLAGLRNAIINGNFDVWQRGTSFTGSEYGADRWGHVRNGTTHTATRQPFTVGQTAVPNEPTYFCRTVVSSVAGAGNYALLEQKIEDVRTFAGQQITISFWAKVDATKNIAVELVQVFGTGGSPSANVTSIGTTKVSIGTTFQKVTVTATVPSINGKTLGTNNDHYFGLLIWFDAGSTYNARTDTLGQQSGTFEIAQVQLEPGPVATPFERRPVGQELALAQRYYASGTAYFDGAANGGSQSVGGINTQFPVTMRSAPTMAFGTLTSILNAQVGGTRATSVSANSRYALSVAAGSLVATETWTASAEL